MTAWTARKLDIELGEISRQPTIDADWSHGLAEKNNYEISQDHFPYETLMKSPCQRET